MNKRGIVSILAIVLVLSPLMQLAIPMPVAVAQSSVNPWTTPINLSQSGSTSEPSVVMDSNGALHVIWYDNGDEEFIYTRLEGSEWSNPVKFDVPFENEDPRLLLNDARGVIHAFWTNEDNELLYSYISVASLSKKPVWSRIQLLSESVMDFDADIDSKGNIHLVYVRFEETNNLPAGIYHRSAGKPGSPWSKITLLYESLYFRSLDKKTAHIQISVTQSEENDDLFVAWDNQPLRQVYLSKSIDGGKQWEEPILIDGPSESSPNEAPFNLLVHSYGTNVLVIWQSGLQSDVDCTQISQFSSDLGTTWLERRVMFETIAGCPKGNQILDFGDGLLLISSIQDQVYLTAWNNFEWSEPQPQNVLSGFTDPLTFNAVIFRCLQPMIEGNQMIVVGCDEEGDGDIWVTTRDLGTLSDWFGQSAGWKAPVIVTSDQSGIASPIVLCDSEDRKHVLWSQTLPNGQSNFDTAIFYAKLDENGWTHPTRILITPDSRAVQPSITTDGSGHLIAVWASSQSGRLYSSVASAAQAHNAFNWSEAVPLPVVQTAASSPDVLVGKTGRLFVGYAIRLNEDRGVYLTTSDDGGKTWALPARIFDAVMPKWYVVDHPELGVTSDGILHLIWTQNSLTDYIGSIALYYSRSEDNGSTWSRPQLVVEESFEWERILIAADDTVHLFWSSEDKTSGLRHEFSKDLGVTWSAPANLAGIGEYPGPMDVVSDKNGRLHLVQAVQDITGIFSIKYQVWNGARWSVEDISTLNGETEEQITGLSACLDSMDQLTVIYSTFPADLSASIAKGSLNMIGRSIQKTALEAPSLIRIPLPTQAITSTLEALPAIVMVTPTAMPPQPTSQQVSPIDAGTSGGGAESQTKTSFLAQPWVGLALGLGLASIIIVLVFGLILHNRKRRGYY